MNLKLKLVVVKVSTVEKKLVLNGCMDWNETTANDEIQVSAVGITYYRSKKSRRKQRKEIEVPSPSSEIPNEE
nr:hypothetical protein [Tanacetum cinerariifolium]